MFGLSDSEFDIIRSLPAKFPKIKSVLIFESRSMWNFRRGSDVDIAIKGDLTPQDIWQISGYLNDEIPSVLKYDVVDYDKIGNLDLIAHIDKCGTELSTNRLT